MFKKILILMIIFSQVAFAEIRINEVMAEPICSDYVCEWIELYNNDENSANISGWKISDSNDRDDLESYSGEEEIIIPGKGFALIIDTDSRVFHNFDVGKNVIWIYVDDNAIGNGLNTTGEDIILYDKDLNVVDSVVYEEVSEGKSYSLINNDWNESEPTPGRDNNENKSLDYSVIKINEFLPDPIGDDNANMPNGEWVELYNSGNENLDLLGFKFYDNYGSEPDIIITDTTTDGSSIIKKKNYLVIYMNGVSAFLNNKGYENIKLYDLQNNLIDEVSYEGSKEGISWSKVDNIWQYSLPTPNSDNKGEESIPDSVLRIEKIYDLGRDDKAEWGDVLRIKLNIQKADSSKSNIKLWVENEKEERVSKITQTDVYEKFSNYSSTLPVQIIDNCDNKFSDGEYKIVVSGLDKEDYEKVDIGGKSCVNIKEENKNLIETKKTVENVLESGSKEVKSETVIYGKDEVIYQSKQDEAKRYALFFLNGVSVLLLIYYIFKK